MSFWKNLSVSKMNASKIVINGQTYSGSNVNIVNGRVIINGNDVTPESKTINISVEGDIESLHVDACSQITVYGDVHNLDSGVGGVNCRNVTDMSELAPET